MRRESKLLARLMRDCMPEPMSGCWLWVGAVSSNGYGILSYDNKGQYAHRLSWAAHNGPIPDGMFVCHKCDVRSCINPGHLFIGTNKENIQDACRKGRMSRGEHRPSSKLRERDIPEIRRRLALGHKHRSIASDYGVAHCTIQDVGNGRTWCHV